MEPENASDAEENLSEQQALRMSPRNGLARGTGAVVGHRAAGGNVGGKRPAEAVVDVDSHPTGEDEFELDGNLLCLCIFD